ncbi:MAG: membrane protein insertase YidC [Oscillospiraceae bacterium]|jgi:YidC/Oxa1 family membrane protein insertase|nr:membrane protein insertase YidC [Oscillospiraceae bacterium]
MIDAVARIFGVLLMWLYELAQNYGIAVILFAIAVRALMLPFQMKSKRGELQSLRISPKVKAIEKKFESNKRQAQVEIANLYKEEGVSPASGCLWSFIQLPIWLLLYQAIRNPLTTMMGIPKGEAIEAISAKLAEFAELLGRVVPAATDQIAQAQFISQLPSEQFEVLRALPEVGDKLRQLNYSFLGLNLGAVPQWKFWTWDYSDPKLWAPLLFLGLIPVVSGVAQFIYQKVLKKIRPQTPVTTGGMNPNSASMMIMFSAMSVVFGFSMPAALSVYWIAGSLVTLGQDVWLYKRYTKILDVEDAEKNRIRAQKQAELERKHGETEKLKAENARVESASLSKKRQQNLEKQERQQKQAEWERKNAPSKQEGDEEPSRVGNRKYARGRAYDPDRYGRAPVIALLPPDAEDAELAEEADGADMPDVSDITINTVGEIAPFDDEENTDD